MRLRKERLIAGQVWDTVFTNRIVPYLGLFVGLLITYAAYSGWVSFRQQNQLRAAYQQQARHDWLNNPDKHPHRMAHYGHFVFRPKAPLSMFDGGMESFLGSTLFLEAHKQNSVNFSEAGFSTGLLRFGEISLAMILQLLLPLLIFFVGFSSVASERDNGTLKIVLSQGVSGQALHVGKSLGLIGVMSTLFIPVMLTTVVLWLIAQNGTVTLDEAIRLGLLVVAYFVYLTFFCLIAVLVSARSRSAKAALVTLIGLWLMLTLVLPRASQALGATLFAAPSKVAFFDKVGEDVHKEGDSHNPNDPHYKALKDSLLAAYRVDSVQQLPFNYSGFVMAEGEKISATIYNQHFDELLTIYDRQNEFSRAVAFLDPFMAIRNLSMALSGTDYANYLDFGQQAEQYRYDMAQKLNVLQMKYVSNYKPGPGDPPITIDNKHWEEIPEFHYTKMSVRSVLANEPISLFALAFWAFVLLYLVHPQSKNLRVV
ncbi:ABC transporter permease [Spirosoma oryzicola]|uniref:ABC transporter permease n=1 Tax=Spirosoma oryzicola TaxID=2898794 RepID=UPI001E2D649D|nr:DUF3526 domain-containing protein [Spirosoma oryzicola]UHG94062.1 DUF3526 domain-containing protein [Spirosoma oryzicola]